MNIKHITSPKSPPPAGTYSVAVRAGNFVFLSGQTPRDITNTRHGDKPFAEQVRMALDNLETAAQSAGLTLANAVKVNIFLRDHLMAKKFDEIYANYVGSLPPARTLTQSNLVGFDVEIDAILYSDSN